eukprot:TRINITY_DN13280_c1_g3_i1.p1 TRINITY_DN13280_c1_g3~~TRINITY_DN13280_c1_g3_i1.p1  ORF type:complete len:255 (-),score=7.19 TRINITY_DN13280_c1_g3_i1:272-961(-)
MEAWFGTDAGSIVEFHIKVTSAGGEPFGFACCPASEGSRRECLDDLAALLFRWSLRFKTRELEAVGEADILDVMKALKHMKASQNEESPSEEEETPQSATNPYGPFSSMPYASRDPDVLSQRSGSNTAKGEHKGSSRHGRFRRGNPATDPHPDRSIPRHSLSGDEGIWRTSRIGRLMAEHLYGPSYARAPAVLPSVTPRTSSDPLEGQQPHGMLDQTPMRAPRGSTSET